MVSLYGRSHSKRDLAACAGTLGQFAGVRLFTLGDGVERGVRCLEFRTGTGFSFKVMVDRGLDVAECEYRGAAIGWQSPTGFRSPALHDPTEENGLGFLRSFSGLLVTCGLDHALAATAGEPADHFRYVQRKSIDHPLHGRVGMIPARLGGYGEDWRGEDCILWCEGVVQQSAVYGEDLHLIRRIEAKVGDSAFTVHDRVVNHGFYRTPHMLLYHVNFGYPLLDAGSRIVAPIRHIVWASHADALEAQGIGYRTQAGPRHDFREQVYEHAVAAGAGGVVPVALVNRAFAGGQGLGFLMEFNRAEFPHLMQWQNFQEGLYTLGIEPSTHHALGRSFARERGELIWLEHGEERRYGTRFAVLDGAAALDAAERRIAAICPQPDEEYVVPTGRWDG